MLDYVCELSIGWFYAFFKYADIEVLNYVGNV